MKKFRYLLLSAFLGMSVAAFAQPKLEIVGGDTYNWGTVKPGDSPLKATIVVKNSGDQALEITKVQPGCGCTTAPISKNSLPVGDTASISVTLNVSGNVNDVTKSITLESNDPAGKKYIYLKAKIFYPIKMAPTMYFTFNEMQVGMKKEASIKLTNQTAQSITLSNFVISDPTIQLNVMGKKILKPGEEFELIATATPNRVGYYNASITFETNDKDMKTVTVAAYGSVKESIMNAGAK
jgi:hypothetical protein